MQQYVGNNVESYKAFALANSRTTREWITKSPLRPVVKNCNYNYYKLNLFFWIDNVYLRTKNKHQENYCDYISHSPITRHQIQSRGHHHKAYTSSSWDKERATESTAKKERWLQGYCSVRLSEPQEHAVPHQPLFWPAAWRQEVSTMRSYIFKTKRNDQNINLRRACRSQWA